MTQTNIDKSKQGVIIKYYFTNKIIINSKKNIYLADRFVSFYTKPK